ncbi:MAG: sensor histidine kinase, partial [Gammaproteobacteria bacterium]
VPPPTTWEWQQMFVYLALAAALVPAQVLAAARAAASRTQAHLERSARSLEKANQGLQQFIHMASHDLREPVNTVSQFAGLLQEDHQAHLPATAQAHLQRIGHGAQRMRVLLDDVVQFASLAQQTSIAMTPVDLDSCLMAARQKLGPVVAARGALISSRTLPVVMGDAALLETLLTHLLDNALKFVPADRTPVIEIDAQLSKGTAIIRIADNGIGIDPAYADRLFEPFARLTTRRQFNGSGLGLAVCRQIVQMHHGSIGIRPGEGQGAVVDISLPFG